MILQIESIQAQNCPLDNIDCTWCEYYGGLRIDDIECYYEEKIDVETSEIEINDPNQLTLNL